MSQPIAILATIAAILLSGCATTTHQDRTSATSLSSIPPMVYAGEDRAEHPGASELAAILANEKAPGSQRIPVETTSPNSALFASQLAVQAIRAPQLEAELLAVHGIRPSQVEMSDQTYALQSHEWIVETFLPYIQSYFESNDIRVIGEGMDCDNIAQLFRQQLALSNTRAGGAAIGDVPCGILKTKQESAFGGVPESGSDYHSLIIIRTDQGWFAIEPQTQAITSFASYPNRPHVEWVLL